MYHLTATFFCEMTTAQSFPLTPMEVMLAAVMALKAYSKDSVSGHDHSTRVEILSQYEARSSSGKIHTNLVQSTLIREDSDMSVVGASCGENRGQSGMKSWG